MVNAKYLKLTRLAVETYSIKTKQKVNKRRKGAKLKRVQGTRRNNKVDTYSKNKT